MCDKRGRKAWQRIPKQNLCRWCKSGICPPSNLFMSLTQRKKCAKMETLEQAAQVLDF